MAVRKPPRRRILSQDLTGLAGQPTEYTKQVRDNWWDRTIPGQTGTGIEPEAPQIIAIEDDSPPSFFWEICRKVSAAILTQDGLYEYPTDWDGTDSSPTWPGGLPDPTESWLEVPRVHEIVYINEADYSIKREKFYVPEGLGPTSAFTVDMTVEVSVAGELHVPFPSRIPLTLLQHPNAVNAIGVAQDEASL